MVDVHAALLPTPPWTFQSVDGQGKLSASRIDLVLANHAAMTLVRDASVLDTVRDGGHSPVLVRLRLGVQLQLDWCRPRPRPPALFFSSSEELQQSSVWHALLDQWLALPRVRAALDPAARHSAATLSTTLVQALHCLVDLAGGWQTRPASRRPAFDSDEMRRVHRVLDNLHRLHSLVHRALQGSPGCWPRTWDQLLRRLADDGVDLPRTSASVLLGSCGAAMPLGPTNAHAVKAHWPNVHSEITW